MAAYRKIKGFDIAFGFGDFKAERELNKSFDLFQRDGGCRTQEAVVADLHESGWQDML